METLFAGSNQASTTLAQLMSGSPLWVVAFVVIIIWSIVWKGIALWKAARLSHKKWFILFLVLNTVGILEIIYVYFIARKYDVETLEKE